MSENNGKKLFIEEDCNVYEKIKKGEEIIFKNDKGEEVIRYKFSPYHSIYNKNATDDEKIDNLEVFHFHKINNCFFSWGPGEVNYEDNVHKGYMTASFYYLILQLLEDETLSKVDFEINLVSRAVIIENGKQVQKTDIYDKILSYPDYNSNGNKELENFDLMAKEDKFRIFRSIHREVDKDWYKDRMERLFDAKNIEIHKGNR